MEQPTDIEGILKVTKFPRAQLFGLRRDSTGRRVAGATYEEAAQGSLCESIRAGKMVSHALLLPVTEEVRLCSLLLQGLERCSFTCPCFIVNCANLFVWSRVFLVIGKLSYKY